MRISCASNASYMKSVQNGPLCCCVALNSPTETHGRNFPAIMDVVKINSGGMESGGRGDKECIDCDNHGVQDDTS